MNKTAL